MSSFAPRIAYVGLPLGALALQRAGHTPVVIALGHPDAPGARRVHRLREAGVPVLDAPKLDTARIQKIVTAARPDVLLSWFWPQRIPLALLSCMPRGAFGVHPSLLPRWRGPDPYFWAILAGDAQTGVTLHRVEAAYDTGAIVASEALDVRAQDTAWSLAKRLDRPSLRMLVACAERLAHGDTLTGQPQDPALASEAPRPSDQELAIAWHAPVDHILRLVRAAAPYPGATAEVGQQIVEIVAAEAYAAPLPRALAVADAVHVSGRGVVVKASDGGVLLKRVRAQDGSELRGAAVSVLFADGLTELSPP